MNLAVSAFVDAMTYVHDVLCNEGYNPNEYDIESIAENVFSFADGWDYYWEFTATEEEFWNCVDNNKI